MDQLVCTTVQTTHTHADDVIIQSINDKCMSALLHGIQVAALKITNLSLHNLLLTVVLYLILEKTLTEHRPPPRPLIIPYGIVRNAAFSPRQIF